MSDQENPAARFAQEVAANTEKVLKATQLIANTRDEDVKVGTTPKHLVMRRDKVELFRYEPLAQQTVSTPVLVAYGLVGRYTMADLQPDRSLVRSLLNKGLDLWLIDWGQPGRNERWLTCLHIQKSRSWRTRLRRLTSGSSQRSQTSAALATAACAIVADSTQALRTADSIPPEHRA